MRLAALLSVVLVMTAAPAVAAEKESDYKARMERLTAGNPHAAGLEEKAKKLFETLPREEVKRLAAIQTGIQMVRAVDFVHTDVAETVKLCGKANPGLKGEMESHLKGWEGKVMPLVADHQKRMERAVGKDNFTDPKTIKDFIDQADKSAKFAQKRQSAALVRVTTPEACQSLNKSMDSSSVQLVDALRQIRWPGEK